MKTLLKFAGVPVCFLVMVYFFVNLTQTAKSSDEKDYYEENGYEVISEDTTWRKGDELNFDKPIAIVDGKTLTIEKGAVITFAQFASIEVDKGRIIAEGTAEEKIVFKRKDVDSEYSITFNNFDNNDYESFFRYVVLMEGGSAPSDQSRGIIDKLLIKTANAQFYPNESGIATIQINGGKLHMENCEFKDSLFQDIQAEYYDYYDDDDRYVVLLTELEVINSNFSVDRAVESEQCDYFFEEHELPNDLDMASCKEKVYLKNNYYGDPDGPNIDIDGQEVDPDKGFYLKGDFKLEGWSSEKFLFEPEVSGASSVLFLPGIKASHLYKYDSDTDKDLDELWIPNWFGNDIAELGLDSDGKSIEKVFTKDGDVLKDTVMGSLYESFLNDLNQLKTDNIISDYKAFAYDWRQSVEDIAKNGTPYQLETDKIQIKLIQDEVNNLAQNSKSGKVTIVAHSNGGLVAKAIMVEHPELAEKIDKIILVASPQMGTPLATLSFLYGYEEALPTLLSQEKARTLIENMPGAYGLLPSAEYLNRQRDADDALINFSSENSEKGEVYKEAYGDKIDNLDEFRDFLLAKKDNREKPDSEEINFENILNEELLDEAISIHGKLDNWTPPSNIKVIQLAGWGLPTVSGIDYIEKEESDCIESEVSPLPLCHDSNDHIFFPEPKFTTDGDAVVTTPSGLMINELDNVKRYWFDIERYNKKYGGIKHKNFLEAISVKSFLKNEIQNNNVDLPEYISTEKLVDFENMEPRIKMSLYSPLDIHLYNSTGNHTGYTEIQTDEGPQRIIEENIPNSFYFQLGDVKYVGFEEGENVEVKLDGYGDGSYTLKIEEVRDTENGEDVINHVTFKNLPTSADTQVELIIPESGLEDISSLKADYDGDGDNDYVLEPVLGEEITLPDVTPPTIKVTSPENKSYLKNEILDINYTISDDRSSEDNIKLEKLLDNQVITQDKIDLSLLKTGEHKLIIRATDEADNIGEKEVVFNINTNMDVLKGNINNFYDLKLIKTNQERKMLLNNLLVVEREIEFYNSIKNNIFIKSKVKKILLNILGNQIENHIDIIIHKIKQDKKNYVTMIKEIIISDLEFIKSSIK